MKLSDIIETLVYIDGHKKVDPEKAHAVEDKLHIEVLYDIANGVCPDPQRYAREALKTREIEFPRWYS